MSTEFRLSVFRPEWVATVARGSKIGKRGARKFCIHPSEDRHRRPSTRSSSAQDAIVAAGAR